ncbi:hypothetical protein [Lysobacter tyrosinilyticus]
MSSTDSRISAVAPRPSNEGDASSESAVEAQNASVPATAEDELINDDERKKFNWQSRWPQTAWKRIRLEAAYVAVVFLLSAVGIFLTWRGEIFYWLAEGCADCQAKTLNRYAYLMFAGVLGGSLFGLKYLYKVVARGWWNIDRSVWRLFSPLLSGGMAFAVGALADAGLFGFTVGEHQSGASFVSLGFIAGYFADSASRKLQEIADTLFGHPQAKKS